VTEYWIWNNTEGGWWDKHGSGYTRKLHEAGRFAEQVARERLQGTNMAVAPTDHPDEVMIPVNNTFLPAEAQRILAEYEATGDHTVIDNAYFAAQNKALVASDAFQESWGQFLRGEGQEIDQDIDFPEIREESTGEGETHGHR
jgi:hypothetical protein